MSQSAFTIRLDSELKTQFDSLCEEFGMSTNTAFNIYVRQVVRNRRIPFTIEAPAKDDVMAKGRAAFYAMRQAAAEAGVQDMSLDEINEEIRLAREGR
ncbi:MAG: type II toxin-antitoxin system RelB/DinJ family antitoxin [Bacteroidales bacterium]|nr:type II toxin-antitoxin system RelB/DinJ family antitoxin [Candidatus Cryptobacteroides choladohippi]